MTKASLADAFRLALGDWHLSLRLFEILRERMIELVHHFHPLGLAIGDHIQVFFHTSGKLIIHNVREILHHQVVHQLGEHVARHLGDQGRLFCQRNEAIRRNKPLLRMYPPQQRFGTGDGTGFDEALDFLAGAVAEVGEELHGGVVLDEEDPGADRPRHAHTHLRAASHPLVKVEVPLLAHPEPGADRIRSARNRPPRRRQGG